MGNNAPTKKNPTATQKKARLTMKAFASLQKQGTLDKVIERLQCTSRMEILTISKLG